MNQNPQQKPSAHHDAQRATYSRPKGSAQRESQNVQVFSGKGRLKREIATYAIPTFLIVCLVIASVTQLFRISILENRFFTEKAANQHLRKIEVYPERGRILDAQGKVLATTTYIYTIGVTPGDVHSLDDSATMKEIVKQTAEHLEMSEKEVADTFAQKDATYLLLRKGVSREKKEALEAWLKKHEVGGFAIDPVMKRSYPEKDYLSPVIGFTTSNDRNPKGISGLEYTYNEELMGQVGYAFSQVDNYSQTQLPNSKTASISAKDGNDLVLTINENLQRAAELTARRLADAANPNNGALAVVLDPNTGAVLAMAGSNRYDLNDPMGVPLGKNPNTWDPSGNQDDVDYLTGEVWRNKVISQPYEPGSIMKPLTLSIALDEGQADLNEWLSDAPLQMGDWQAYKMTCWAQADGYNHGDETIQDALMRSCNPPFAILAKRVGIRNFYDYVKRIGFTTLTGIDLPAESVGQLHANPSITDLMTLSIGEQSTVTAMRMAMAYSALANGGKVLRPYVVDRIQTRKGDLISKKTAQVERRVFSESITQTVRELMIKGMHRPEGSVQRTFIPGLRMAGKTGTSEDNADKEWVTYSVAIVAPYDDPKFVVLTSLQQPRKDTSPYFMQSGTKWLVERCAEEFKIPGNFDDIDYDAVHAFDASYVQNYVGLSYFQAVNDAASIRDVLVVAPEGTKHNEVITEQWPNSTEGISTGGVIYVGTAAHPMPDEWKKMVDVPDFSGLTYLQARYLAHQSGVNILLSGTNPGGTVTYQDLAPSSGSASQKVRFGSVVAVSLDGEALPNIGIGAGQPILPTRERISENVNGNEEEADVQAEGNEAWRRFDQSGNTLDYAAIFGRENEDEDPGADEGADPNANEDDELGVVDPE